MSNAAQPVASLGSRNVVCSGRIATSSVALLTSMPMKRDATGVDMGMAFHERGR